MSVFRLGTVSKDASEIPVVGVAGHIYRLSDVFEPRSSIARVPSSIFAFIEEWDACLSALRSGLSKFVQRAAPLDPGSVSFLSPVVQPRKIICVGINYRDHLEEMKVAKAPDFPYAFLRPATSLIGHGADVALPDWPKLVDWEAELGIVIARKCRHVRAANARDVIAGYTVVNDLSARDWIENRPFVGIDWVMQKAWDAFQPTGPWLTPAEFVPDPQALAIELSVNGTIKQRSNTSKMIFGVAEIVEHLSAIMTLEPGDVIATGTPAGVGYGQSPRERLAAGDRMRVSIEGLGTLENRIVKSIAETS